MKHLYEKLIKEWSEFRHSDRLITEKATRFL